MVGLGFLLLMVALGIGALVVLFTEPSRRVV